jgi:hypothetical protein
MLKLFVSEIAVGGGRQRRDVRHWNVGCDGILILSSSNIFLREVEVEKAYYEEGSLLVA